MLSVAFLSYQELSFLVYQQACRSTFFEPSIYSEVSVIWRLLCISEPAYELIENAKIRKVSILLSSSKDL